MNRGEKIAQIRQQIGMSQARLASLSGLRQGALSNYETGKRNPGIDALQQILPHLGVSLEEFLALQIHDIEEAHQKAPPGSAERSKSKQEFVDLIDDMPEAIVTRLLRIAREVIQMRDA